MIRGHR